MKRILCIFIICVFLAGCGTEAAVETTALADTVASTTVPDTTFESETIVPTESRLLSDTENGKVCVGIVPTEVGSWRYAVIPDQEAAAAAFEKAVDAKYSDEWWIKGDKTVGLMVCCNGEFWEFVQSGELVCALGRVKAEDAAALYELCAAAAAEHGWQEAVRPEQLTGIVSATLRQGETEISLTDPDKLAQVEAMLSAGKFSLGGTGCPFNVLLTLELETGESLLVALATDGCGVWMSEGSYYEFASDSQPLYDLFGVTFEYGSLTTK